FLLGNVPQNHRKYLLAVELHMRDGGFQRKFLSIPPCSKDSIALPHLTPGDFRRPEFAHVVLVGGPVAGRNEFFDELPERLDFRATEHLLGGGIEENYVLLLVHGDHSTQC